MKKLCFMVILLALAGMMMAQTYFNESFEGVWSGTPTAPEGWVQTHPSGTDTETWEKSVWTTSWSPAGDGTKPSGTAFGTAVAHFNDYNSSANNVFRLTSSDINLRDAGNPRISFYYFYNSGSAVLRVWASNDGGGTWTNISGSIGATGATWTKLNFNLGGDYLVSNAQIALEVTSAWGSHDLWLDNLTIEETPIPLTGTKTIGVSGDYTSFTSAINALNNSGVGAGGITFNVEAGFTSTELCPTISATGTIDNPIIFQRSGIGANPLITAGTGLGSSDAIFTISGSDYVTFDGIDLQENAANITSTTQVEYGFYIKSASATNGAQNNTIKNCAITLNKLNTSTKGIYQYYSSTPTSVAGANSYNRYHNITFSNSSYGIHLVGSSSTNPDLNTEISNCSIGRDIADDLGGATTAYGLYATYQSGINIFNNEIRNVTTSNSYSYAYGLYMTNCYGANNIYNNKIHDIKSSISSTYGIYGMNVSLASSFTNSAKIYNNMIWGITSSYTGSGSTSYLVYGIYLGGSTATNTYYVDFNSIRVVGPATAYSAGVYFSGNSAVNYLRSNIIANFTPAQTTYKHVCTYFSSATLIGATGSLANNNIYYVDNATNGFVVRGSSTDYSTIDAWYLATTHDADSRPTNPRFTSASNLYIQTDAATPVESRGSFFEGAITWAANDIDGNLRSDSRPDIGADEGDFLEEIECVTPSNQPTNLSLIPTATAIGGSFTVSDAEAYLVVRHTDRDHDTTPTDGAYYSAGAALGNGTIIAVGSGSSFNTTGLTAETEYYFTVYSYNASGLNAPKYLVSGPLTGSMTTLPAAPLNPATFTATASSPSQIDLLATANANTDNIMVAWNTTSSFGTPLATGYSVGNPITGGGTVLYIGPAAGLTNHTGLTEATSYYYKVWSYISADRTTYYSYSTGITANATTPTSPVDVPVTQDFESITVAGNLPIGWTKSGTKWSTQITPQDHGRAPYSGTDYVTCAYGATASDWLFSRGVNLDSSKLYDFSIMYNTEGDTGWNSFKMYVGTSATSGAMTTVLAGIDNPANVTYQQLVKNAFQPPVSGVYYIGFQVLASNNPWYMNFDDFAVTETPVDPAFAVSPSTKDFGTISVGTTLSQTFTISNAGQGTLNIASIELTGTGIAQYTLTDTNEYPARIDGGNNITVSVTFNPITPGTFTANLKITDDLAKSVHNIPISGSSIDYNYGGGDSETTAGGYYFANSLANNAPSKTNYEWINPSTHTEYTGTWTGSYGESMDDGYSTPFNFNFNFYGVDYTQLYFNTNGFISLGASSSAFSNAAIPTAAAPNAIIALFWDDMEYFPDQTKVYTYSDADKFILTYMNLGRTGDWDPTMQITAQVILYSSGIIKMQYKEIIGDLTSTHSATIGIENADGTKGIQYHMNGLTGPVLDGLAVMFGTNPYTLPVELSSFTATFNVSNFVNVTWTTQSESDALGYSIFRSESNDRLTAVKMNNTVIQAQNQPTAHTYHFDDNDIESSKTYYYWLEAYCLDQTSSVYGPVSVKTNPGSDIPVIPLVTELKLAYPNPFNPTTTIAFDLATPSPVKIEIYNIKGQKISTLTNKDFEAGRYTIVWNGKDSNSKSCSSGVYFYRMQAGKYISTKKIMMMK